MSAAFDTFPTSPKGQQRMSLQAHPFAEVFPLIEGPDFDALVDDIRQHGLREPIVLHEGMILDGRNRARACQVAGVDPRYEMYAGDDPASYVVSLNLRRRHLDEIQRGMASGRLAKLTRGRPRINTSIEVFNSLDIPPPSPRITQAEAAEMMNVSLGSTQRAAVVLDKGVPELIAMADASKVSLAAAADVAQLPKEEQAQIVARGEAEILAAAKQIRTAKAEQRRIEIAAIKAIAPPLPDGTFETIVIDPPWPMEKIERDVAPNQVAFEYPTMTEEELAAMALPAADNAHIFLWTTHKFLPMALRLLERWGFRYVCTFVWHKPGGFQPFGLPQYNCEFALYGRRGTPSFEDLKAFPTCFQAPRREHSRKPDEFYDLVRRVTAGPRIDIFSREAREGFDQFGNEADKFSGAA